MALLESSEGGRDPRIHDYVMRESISLAASSNGGVHSGSVDIPLGVKVNAMHVSIGTAISGGSVDALDFGISNDGGLFFPGGSTRTLAAGSSYFSVFEYASRSLIDGHLADPGVRFLGDGDPDNSRDILGSSVVQVRAVAPSPASENNSRVTLYTKQLDGEAATTTAGSVVITVYGTRYIF